jgi:PKHD-type hydroxylase
MFLIQDVLAPDRVRSLCEALAQAPTYDGKRTAGRSARTVKANRQFDSASPAAAAAADQVLQALQAHDVVREAARPRRWSRVMFSAYDEGMRYGTHVDDAIMAGEPPLRSDLSWTLFLTPPGDYDGGELVIESSAGENAVKLPAGSIVLYPSTELHRVEPVTRGRRLAAVGWIQSLVRDAAQRELLFDLAGARRVLLEHHGPSREADQLQRVASNLLRMWAQP